MLGPLQVRAAIYPLRLIFIGGLLLIFDVTLSTRSGGTGFKLDLLNDTVGAVMIAMGVTALQAIRLDERQAALLGFVKWVSYAGVLKTVDAIFIYDRPAPLSFALTVFGLLALAAIVVFCTAMRRFCEAAPELTEAAASWCTTRALFVVLLVAPLGLFYALALYAMATGQHFRLDHPALLLAFVAFAAPVVHLFMSTSRMKQAAEQTRW